MLYRDAGVNIEAAESALGKVGQLIRSTQGGRVLSDSRSFCGLYLMPSDDVLCIANDGVGTKLQVAMMAGSFEGTGGDLVRHMANDLLCHGACPMCMVDYFATMDLKEMEEAFVGTLTGMCRACEELSIAVIAGETAEMPGTYVPGQYDFVGTMVGWVANHWRITGARIDPGDKVIGLASNGLHTNGFSLARKAIFEIAELGIDDPLPWGPTVAEELLRTHRCYIPIIKPWLREIRGMAHITGGGLPGNLIRVLPEGCRAVLDSTTWEIPKIFTYIKQVAEQSDNDYFRTFNTGVGLAVVTLPGYGKRIIEEAACLGVKAWEIGEIVEGDRSVVIN